MNKSEILQCADLWQIAPEEVGAILKNKNSLRSRFLAAIRIGQANGIHSRDLQAMLDTDHRTIEDLALKLRAAGFPVIGDASGYYMAENLEDGKRCFLQLHARARTTLSSLEKIMTVLQVNELL